MGGGVHRPASAFVNVMAMRAWCGLSRSFFGGAGGGMQNVPCWIKPSEAQAVGCVGANSYCNDVCRTCVPRQPGRGRHNRWSDAQVGATAQSSFRSSQAPLLGFIVVCTEKCGCMFISSLTCCLCCTTEHGHRETQTNRCPFQLFISLHVSLL